jgi:hypothetical protein
LWHFYLVLCSGTCRWPIWDMSQMCDIHTYTYICKRFQCHNSIHMICDIMQIYHVGLCHNGMVHVLRLWMEETASRYGR